MTINTQTGYVIANGLNIFPQMNIEEIPSTFYHKINDYKNGYLRISLKETLKFVGYDFFVGIGFYHNQCYSISLQLNDDIYDFSSKKIQRIVDKIKLKIVTDLDILLDYNYSWGNLYIGFEPRSYAIVFTLNFHFDK